MNFYSLKLWVPTSEIILPQVGPKKMKSCFYFFGENTLFLDSYSSLGIKPTNIKYVYIPTIVKPYKSMMTNEIRTTLVEHKLIPVKDYIGNYSRLDRKNFFYDPSLFFENINKRLKIVRYNTGKGYKLYSDFINSLNGIPNNFLKTIFYTINLDKPIPKRLFNRKFFILYDMLLNWDKKNINNLPFDSIILTLIDINGIRYLKIFDKNLKNNNIARIRAIMMKIQSNLQTSVNLDKTILSDTIADNSNIIDNNNSRNVTNIVSDYLSNNKSNPDLDLELNTNISNNILSRSVFYRVTGNDEKAKSMANALSKLPVEKQSKIINVALEKTVPVENSKSYSNNLLLNTTDVTELTDHRWPKALLDQRSIDFNVTLKNDITNIFKQLEEKEYPLKVKSIDVKRVDSAPSEIQKTIQTHYSIKLIDNDGNEHDVKIIIPYLTENGSFLVNGQNKVLIYQLLRFPIFFPSIDVCRIQSAFSVIKLINKPLKNLSYFQLFIGNYKFPLIQLLAFEHGFSNVLKDFGIEYEIKSK